MTVMKEEAPDEGRNSNYRCCLPRDAYYVVNALNCLDAGHTIGRHLTEQWGNFVETYSVVEVVNSAIF
jgi:hypothetical protein